MPPPAISPRVGGEEVAHLQLERLDDGLRCAPSEALQQDSPIIAEGDAQAVLAVVVSGAAGRPPVAGSLHSLEAGEEVIDAHRAASRAGRSPEICSAREARSRDG
jgi:hypothetical protein